MGDIPIILTEVAYPESITEPHRPLGGVELRTPMQLSQVQKNQVVDRSCRPLCLEIPIYQQKRQ